MPTRRVRRRPRYKNSLLSPSQIEAAYKLYRYAHMSLRDLASMGWERWGYSSRVTAEVALYTAFKREGYVLRSRTEAIKLAAKRGKYSRKHRPRDDHGRWIAQILGEHG